MERQDSGSSVFSRKQYSQHTGLLTYTSSQNAPVAPMYESKPIIPGQYGFNPCGFAACLCNGTCTLRIGCYVIGAIIIGLNLLNILYIYVIKDHLVKSGSSISHAISLNEYIREKYPVEVIDWIVALLFGIVPGVCIILAAAMLEKIACLLCIFTIVAGILAHFIDVVVTTKIIAGYPGKDETSQKVVTATHTSNWMCFVLRTGLHGFCILCALALKRQIVYGVYPRDRSGVPAGVKVFADEIVGDGPPDNVVEAEASVDTEKESL